MAAAVFVLGGYQTDFARHFQREGVGLEAPVAEVVDETLESAGLSASDVGAIHVGNAFGELFTGQAQLGAMPATVRHELWGKPAARHEGACASGGLAVLAASAEIEAGRTDCALVLGIEQERNVPGELAAQHMGTAAWIGHEGREARYMWPYMFSRVAEVVAEKSALQPAHLAALAESAFDNARHNDKAQTRRWSFPDGVFAQGWEDDTKNPIVEGRLRRLDCGQVTDGAVGLVLASASFAREYARRRGLDIATIPRLLGWGHRTAGLGLEEKLARRNGYLLPHLRETVRDAYRRAEIPGPEALQGAEVHDCFTITGYLAVDHLGLTAPFESHRAIEDGTIRRSGRFPLNPSGGLIGLGHPVGATGVRMVLDAARQTSGQAGEAQVAGARRFATLNIGGSATTVVAFVVGVEED